ncbi:DUF320 domain-containing protein [Streptomyces sp. p1417]|uniref:DUF320 domain-containing protein n=1 Tax=Streptomyces typhae TaxID=2681492 RepID=A0A6L6X8Q5_9ACTN|nr:DUF320 domain-containing protein [Streptomyces typhae]
MTPRKTVTRVALVAATTAGMALTVASPASAGGVGDFLSPAFGTDCANHHGSHAAGTTTRGSGMADSNFAGLPVGSPVNQCGGADLPVQNGQGFNLHFMLTSLGVSKDEL